MEIRGQHLRVWSRCFWTAGQYITVENNYVYDSPDVAYIARTYEGVREQYGIKFIGNKAERCAGGLLFGGVAIGAEPICLKIDGVAKDNKFIDCGNSTTDALVIRHFDGMTVQGNTITRAGRNGMYNRGLVGNLSKNLHMGANLLIQAVRHVADIEDVTGIKIVGDEVHSPINQGINLTNCSNTAFIAHVIRAPGQAGVNIVDGAGNSFSDPQISGALNDGHDTIRVSGSSDLTIVGGKLGAERNAIYNTTTVRPATPILA